MKRVKRERLMQMIVVCCVYRYLQEFTMLGTAGGMYHFRDQIRAGNPTAFFVLNGDVCSDFPLEELHNFHMSRNEVAEVSKRGRLEEGVFGILAWFEA